MLRKAQAVFIILGLTVVLTPPADAQQATRKAGTIPFEVIGNMRESISGPIRTTRVEVIRTREDLIALWQKLDPLAPVPDVDLRSRTVIAYYYGCSNTCSYVTIERLAVRSGTLLVEATGHEVLEFECDCRPTTTCPVVVIATIHWPHDVVEQTEEAIEPCE